MSYQEQWLDGGENLTEAFAVRIEVFCDEQGYSQEMELDEQDKASRHLLLWDGETAIATGRIYWKNQETIGLGRIAVRKPWRGKGVGALAVAAMTAEARAMGARRAELDAQCRAIGFYEKAGFSVCGGEHMDGHVPHKLMQKIL